jgi:hypothetical protein
MQIQLNNIFNIEITYINSKTHKFSLLYLAISYILKNIIVKFYSSLT